MLSDFLRPPPHTSRVSTGLLLLRVVIGLAFVQYGAHKLGHPLSWGGAKLPAWIQLYAVIAELGGGILLLLGAFTPLGALLIVVDMIGAVFVAVIPRGGARWITTDPGAVTFEKNLYYAAGALALFLTGPGAFSIDALRRRATSRMRRMPRR